MQRPQFTGVAVRAEEVVAVGRRASEWDCFEFLYSFFFVFFYI